MLDLKQRHKCSMGHRHAELKRMNLHRTKTRMLCFKNSDLFMVCILGNLIDFFLRDATCRCTANILSQEIP